MPPGRWRRVPWTPGGANGDGASFRWPARVPRSSRFPAVAAVAAVDGTRWRVDDVRPEACSASLAPPLPRRPAPRLRPGAARRSSGSLRPGSAPSGLRVRRWRAGHTSKPTRVALPRLTERRHGAIESANAGGVPWGVGRLRPANTLDGRQKGGGGFRCSRPPAPVCRFGAGRRAAAAPSACSGGGLAPIMAARRRRPGVLFCPPTTARGGPFGDQAGARGETQAGR